MPKHKFAVSPAHGAMVVTGASGYIGAWIVRDCMEQGYEVRACVRDANNPAKTQHLIELNSLGLRGQVTLYEADLFKAGSYDEAFAGAAAVIHAGATVGFNRETPQEVYDGCFKENAHVIESVKRSGSIRRFVFTSSFAAVGHPRDPGYVFTEKDWCGDNVEAYKGRWSEEQIPLNRDIAYAMAKANTEKLIYAEAAANAGFEALAILPLHVIGPLMSANNDQPWSWQNHIKRMMQGKPYKGGREGRMLWNCVDVRDVARAHRLCVETTVGTNGSRYILAAADRSGELFTWQLQHQLSALFPGTAEVGGEPMENAMPAKATYDAPRAYCLLARQELGLQTYDLQTTLRDTVDAYYKLALLEI